MQPNIIERVWRQDKVNNVDVLNGFVFTGEAKAHKFVISGKNVNTPVDISGTITANFKNANNVLVPLTGTIEDGKAVVVLSKECYAVEGPFSVMIFADTVCIYAAIANVINSSGEVIAYPTATIPSVQELIEEVQDIIASIPQDYSALNQSVQDLKSAITEETRNLNYAILGHWGNAADGKIYSRGDTIVGMDRFIPVTGGNSYTFSFGGFPSSGMSWTYLFDDASDANVGRAGYGNLNTRTITAPSTATKVHVFCTYTSDLVITDAMYIQIELGTTATSYIRPISAIDAILGERVDAMQTAISTIDSRLAETRLNDCVGAMVDVAESYFDKAYQDHKIVYQSQRGAFHPEIMSDLTGYTDCYAITCSQLTTLCAKGITFANSRYALGASDVNHMQPWGYMTDGTGTYYGTLGESFDYMQSSEMFRYAENKGFPTYTISESRQMVRPGDFVFAIDNDSENYKKIVHCAIVISVGYDNNRIVTIEAADNYNDVGGVLNGVRSIDSYVTTWKYGARYPILASPQKATLLYKKTDFSDTAETTGRIWSANISLNPGFHTFVIHGNITGNTIALTYSGVSGNQYVRTMKNGNCMVLTTYLQKPVTWLGIYRDTNTEFSVDDFAIYKGYINPTTGVYGV